MHSVAGDVAKQDERSRHIVGALDTSWQTEKTLTQLERHLSNASSATAAKVTALDGLSTRIARMQSQLRASEPLAAIVNGE